MLLNDRIHAFSELGNFLKQFKLTGNEKVNTVLKNDDFFEGMDHKIMYAHHYNGWFTVENVLFSIQQWAHILTKEKLNGWISAYTLQNKNPKTIAVIMAGNIPLVGFHDFISVLLSGHKIIVKQSSNDDQLLSYLASYLIAIEPRLADYISFSKQKLSDFNAVIATGSNNTARYFDYYFGKVPNIIRQNRNSVAVLTGKETKSQLTTLGEDIFRYYGLGCRSVSKLMIPVGYDFDKFFKALYPYNDIINGAKYANNYDYNKAVYLMSNYKLLENGFLMLKEDESYASPIATLFYETYTSTTELAKKLELDKDKIQCVVSDNVIENSVNFGETQCPKLSDYADGIDIIEFLSKIN